MSEQNPYASFLGDRAPLDTIAATPAELHRIVDNIGEQAETPIAPGKWNPRQIVCHLADCEIVFAFRLRQAAAQDRHIIQPFDQDQWAKAYGTYGVADALAVFTAVRQWNLSFVRGLDSATFSKTLNHPERGDMTIQTVLETMGGHDINHLLQLQSPLCLKVAPRTEFTDSLHENVK